MPKHFDDLVREQWLNDLSFWWHWHDHWHEYLLLRDVLRIFSDWLALETYLLYIAVCTNCSEKCTYYFAHVRDDVKNAPKRLRNCKKNPRVLVKDLQKSLEDANISVDEFTICKTLNKNGVHGRAPRKKPLLSKKKLKSEVRSSKTTVLLLFSSLN